MPDNTLELDDPEPFNKCDALRCMRDSEHTVLLDDKEIYLCRRHYRQAKTSKHKPVRLKRDVGTVCNITEGIVYLANWGGCGDTTRQSYKFNIKERKC